MFDAFVDLWEAAGFLGMSVETLERNYGHHHPEHLKRAAHASGYAKAGKSISAAEAVVEPYAAAHKSKKLV